MSEPLISRAYAELSEYSVQNQIQDPQNRSHFASVYQLYLIVVAFNNDLFGSSTCLK